MHYLSLFKTVNTIGVIFLSIPQPAYAFFRLPCAQPVLVERTDPIVSPGGIAGHTHTIMGASNIGPSADYASLRESTCTSCGVTADLSGYWVWLRVMRK